MKLENQQSTITNPQFSGGRMIGSGSAAGNSSFASASLQFAGIVNTTGSFRLVDTFGVNNVFFLTASSQTVANQNVTQSAYGSTFYISVSGSATAANKVTTIANYLAVSASATLQNVVTSSTTLGVTSSINGSAGNNVYISSGSANYNLAGGAGISDYPYTFPFVAGGLYVGIPGQVVATTIDGSAITFVSASGFIPGIFQAVSSASSAKSIIAFN